MATVISMHVITSLNIVLSVILIPHFITATAFFSGHHITRRRKTDVTKLDDCKHIQRSLFDAAEKVTFFYYGTDDANSY